MDLELIKRFVINNANIYNYSIVVVVVIHELIQGNDR
jgi:hypothetical protein